MNTTAKAKRLQESVVAKAMMDIMPLTQRHGIRTILIALANYCYLESHGLKEHFNDEYGSMEYQETGDAIDEMMLIHEII